MPALTITRSSTTSGELVMPQVAIFAWLSARTFTAQRFFPLTASRQTRLPSAPSEKTSVPSSVGVPRGPSPVAWRNAAG